MLSIIASQHTNSESSSSLEGSTDVSVDEISSQQVSELCGEMSKMQHGISSLTQLCSNTEYKTQQLAFQETKFEPSNLSKQRGLRIGHNSDEENDYLFEAELSSNENFAQLPLMASYNFEKRSKILEKLVDGKEDVAEDDVNETDAMKSLNYTKNSLIETRIDGQQKESEYFFKKNLNGTYTRYNNIAVDLDYENAYLDDYVERLKKDFLKGRKSELKISKFDGLLDVRNYK